MEHLLLSSLALMLFYCLYKLLLSHDTLHRFNRIVILAILVAGIVLPFVRIATPRLSADASVWLSEVVVTAGGIANPDNVFRPYLIEALSPLSGMQSGVLMVGCLLTAFGFLVYYLVQIIHLLRRCHGDGTTLPDGCRLILHDDDFAPYSWMRNIVVSHKDYAANGPMIIAHEREHIRLHHSWDLLLAQCCCALQWWNPAVWLLKRELQAVQEYEADEAMLRSGCNATQYQMRLIESALGPRFSAIANNFSHISIRKRIIMMNKTTSSPWARLKVLTLLPVAALVVIAASCTNPKSEQAAAEETAANPISEVAVVGYAPTAKEEQGEIFANPEELPEYPGGMEAMMKFISDNIRYPQSAQEAEQQGRVVVRFVVNADGHISDAEVLKSVSTDLDAEALRIVRSMPAWTPGKVNGKPVRVSFVIPITFKLK